MLTVQHVKRGGTDNAVSDDHHICFNKVFSGIWSTLNARSICNKLDEFHLYLIENDIDVCCVTETWLNDTMSDALICPDDYVVHRQDRSTAGGGVAVFTKKLIRSVAVELPVEYKHLEIVCVDLSFSTTDCRVICIYRKPGFSPADVTYMIDCVKCLQRLCSTDKLTVIAGDCNLPDIDWSFYSGPCAPIYDAFLNFVNNYGFYQFVQEATREGNILDIVLSTSDTFLSDLTVTVPLSTSDHSAVLFRTNLVSAAIGSVGSVPYWDFERADYNAINSYLSTVDWNDIFSQSITVEGCWSSFSRTLYDMFDSFVPVRYTREPSTCKHKRIRYPNYIRHMIKHKAILWKRCKLTKSVNDKALYKEAAAKCKNAMDKYHAATELALVRKNNLGSFFNFVNSRLRSNVAPVDLQMSDGSIITDSSMKADAFNDFFASVFTRDNGDCPDVSNRAPNSSLDAISFTPHTVRSVLLKLKPTTSAGYDGIPNLFLKKCASSLAFPLSHIFGISFLDGCLPTSWKFAIVTPVHKKGPTRDPNNFRPISLTATCCRVMERIINNTLLRYLLDHHLISKQQHGFIQRRSVSTNLLDCLEDWTLNLQSRHVTDVIFFDFKKAFDTVCHSKLLVKLQSYGICGNLLLWIESFLNGRYQSVRVGNAISSAVPVISGVPQGSVLGPTLFLLFINDVVDIFSDLTVSSSLFADDLKLYTRYNLDAAHNDLQTAITRLVEWAELWQLQVSIPKCSAFRIVNPRCQLNDSIKQLSYSIDGTVLPFVDSIRDLGIHHDCQLKYDRHISLITHNAFKRAVLILKCFHTRDVRILKHAFCTYVRPLLEFSSLIWSPNYCYLIDKLESVQRFFTRRLHGLHQLSYKERLAVLGLETLERRRIIYDLVFCYKYLHGCVDLNIPNFLCVQNYDKTRNNGVKLYKPMCRLEVRKTFLANRVVNVWNSLPADVVLSHSLQMFKRKLASCSFSQFLRFV